MARKLKTFTTSAGFFDLAVAAPSMKAALEAWGSQRNLFHDGFAKESSDPAIVEATMAKPGVVLRRPVGTNGAFGERSGLPNDLGSAARPQPVEKHRPKKERPPAKPIDGKAQRRAAAAFERERQRQERQEQKEQAARERERERRDRAIAAAEAALEEARQVHDAAIDEIDRARQSLDRKLEAEEERWAKKKESLEEALQRARDT